MAARHHPTVLRVTTEGYSPADEYSAKQHARLKVGATVSAEIARGRSVQQNAYYWSVLAKVVEHCPGEWRTPEALHEVLKVATGYCEILKLIGGRLIKVPGSTSFAALTQDQFQGFMDQAMKVIQDELLGGMDIQEFMAHTERREVNAATEIARLQDWGG